LRRQCDINDPHVERLYYRLVSKETITYDDPQPIEREADAFRMRLHDGKVIFEMKEHFATEKKAREAVEDYLMAWEIYTNIQSGHNAIRFEFERADVIDRSPTPGVLSVSGCSHSHSIAGRATIRVTCKEYPAPPEGFMVDSDVESIWNRYVQYKKGREPLLPMANFCLTVLEYSTGERRQLRRKAAKKYNIDYDVLDMLGKLAATRGSELEARKGQPDNQYEELTSAERIWLEAVIKAFIRRAGECAARPTVEFKQITMADFPKL